MMTLLMGVRDARRSGPRLRSRRRDAAHQHRPRRRRGRARRAALSAARLAERGRPRRRRVSRRARAYRRARRVDRRACWRQRIGFTPAPATGIARLPVACRPAILAAAAIYAEIGREVARRGCRFGDGARARRRGAQARVARRAACRRRRSRLFHPAPALPAAAFLIDAVARTAPQGGPQRLFAEGASLRVLEIFERLERADQLGK